MDQMVMEEALPTKPAKNQTAIPEDIEWAYIEPHLQNILDKCYVDYSDLKYTYTKSKIGSVTLGSAGSVVFRLKLHGKKLYIEVANSGVKYFAEYAESHPPYSIKSVPDYSRLPLEKASDIRDLIPQLQTILEKQIDAYPTEFGCCSRFEVCSDTRRCVNPDKAVALVCYYHKNLRKGKIFYGKNKTI